MINLKKSFLLTFSLLFITYSYSQRGGELTIADQNPKSEVSSLSNFNPTMIGGSYVYNKELPTVKNAGKIGIKGSFYLYNKWDNKSTIVSQSEKTYEINNLNFDLEEEKFLSKISKDSVYVYKDLKAVKVKGKYFINIEGSYYEEVYKGVKYSFFKKYSGKLIPPLMNKMTNQQIKPGEFVKKVDYYIKGSDKLKEISLKKRQILKSLRTKDKSKAALYIKENDLSLKNEIEVIDLLKYIDDLK
ncbi:hypothetical protein [Tenacibaculum discolor]|uniref:hypothetical protein n=1 Tax=Tenacibaculum discolor TaxID=361581 RepID=UPI003F797CE1